MLVKRVLISNIPLPSQKIGSWTNLFDYFNKNEDFFDYILSPGESNGKFRYCRKRKWITHFEKFRNFQLKYWICRSFLKELKSISKNCDLIKIVVQDDLSIVEAIVNSKNELLSPAEIIFQFHGFSLKLSKKLDESIDKVIFLTESSYQFTIENNFQFTPESFVIGNFVQKEKFSILSESRKKDVRKQYNICEDSVVITWMSNDRRIKGLHLFEKIVDLLLKKYSNLHINIIGNAKKKISSHNNVKYLGKVDHSVLPELLGLSDFYFFTTLCKEGFGLSVLEASYCGNIILSSKNGSVPEVLENCHNVYFVNHPNNLDSWVEQFNISYLHFKRNLIKKNKAFEDKFSYDIWSEKLKKAIG
jgi:glycosyltransferase involved in cell wall biosynthesis